MISIKSFSKSKGSKNVSNTSNKSGGGGYMTTTIDPHYLWGNLFDGTQDVNGTIYSPTIQNGGTIYTNGLSAITANIGTLNVTGDTTMRAVTADDITSHNVVPSSGDTYDLGSLVRYWNKLYCRNIFCHNLDVTGIAHFKELQIDKVTATNGEIVISPANFHVDKVLGFSNVEFGENGWETAYNLITSQPSVTDYPTQIYLVTVGQLRFDPKTGKELKQQLKVGDYVYCSSFNIGEGTHSNISNQYYRTMVTEVGKTTQGGDEYLYATLIQYYTFTALDAEIDTWLRNCGEVNVQEDDDLVVLGSTDVDRQSAIIISSVNGIDQSVTPPSITQYKGINSITTPIGDFKFMTIGNSGNTFKGNFITQNGHTVEELINNMNAPVYLHTAYAQTANGHGFTKVPESGVTYDYLGMCVNQSQSDSNLTWSDYKWSFIDHTNYQYKLIPIKNTIQITLNYNSATDTITDDLVVYLECKPVKTTPTGVVSVDNNDPISVSGISNNDESKVINFTKIANGNYRFTTTINNYTESQYRYDYKIANVRLYLNSQVVDNYEVVMNGDPQSMLSVSKSIQARVQDVEGNYSTLSMRADSIQTNVTNLSGATSTFRQTYDQFVLNLNNGLTQTGIDITNHKITLTADNFLVKNNNNIHSLYVNSQGLVESRLGFITNPRTSNENTFYPTFYALSMNRFANDPLGYSFGMSGYNKAVNGQPRVSQDPYNPDYTDSVYTDYFNFSAKKYDLNNTISYRIPILTMEGQDFTTIGSGDISNYGAVAGRYRLQISPKDGIAVTWNVGGTPILGNTKDLNGNDVTGIVGWTGGVEKFVCFGPAGIMVKDAIRQIETGWNSTLDDWINDHSTDWNYFQTGEMIRVKKTSSDKYSTLICKER